MNVNVPGEGVPNLHWFAGICSIMVVIAVSVILLLRGNLGAFALRVVGYTAFYTRLCLCIIITSLRSQRFTVCNRMLRSFGLLLDVSCLCNSLE